MLEILGSVNGQRAFIPDNCMLNVVINQPAWGAITLPGTYPPGGDVSSFKFYIDDVEVEAMYPEGSTTLQTVISFAAGVHTLQVAYVNQLTAGLNVLRMPTIIEVKRPYRYPVDTLSGFAPNAGFLNCQNLSKIAPDTFVDQDWSALRYQPGWLRGTGIKSIPAGLFAPLINVNQASNTYSDLSNLVDVPEDALDWGDNLNAPYTFLRCYNLRTLPYGVIARMKNPANFVSMFQQCTKLEININELLEAAPIIKSAANLKEMFYHCPNIKGSALDFIAQCSATHTIGAFYGCTGLSDYSSIPLAWRY